MAHFSRLVDDFWLNPFSGDEVLSESPGLRVALSAQLAHDRRVMTLERAHGARAVISHELSSRLDRPSSGWRDLSELRTALATAHIEMNGADCLYFYEDDARPALHALTAGARIRSLTEDDAAAFAQFQAIVSDADLDEAYVELDHWLVVAAFDGKRIVSAASAYPWQGSRLADIGIVTSPEYRGLGYARAVVLAISREIAARGYEPQYRCQMQNIASRAVAASAGLSWYGNWDVVSHDSRV